MAQALDQSRFGPSVSLHVNGLARHVLSSLASLPQPLAQLIKRKVSP